MTRLTAELTMYANQMREERIHAREPEGSTDISPRL